MQPEEINNTQKNKKIIYVILIIVGIVAILTFLYWIGISTEENDIPPILYDNTNSPSSITKENQPIDKITQQEIKTIDDFNPRQMVFKSSGHCRAIAPQDWAIVSDQYGRGVDLYNADQSEGAGWFMAPILYDLHGEPDQAIQIIMRQLGNENYTFTNPGEQIEEGFIMREFSAITNGREIKGIGLYKKYPVDNFGYVLSYYQGATTSDKWMQEGAIAATVALSIRCTAQYTPTANDGFSSSSSAISDKNDKENVADSWSKRAILGQETVHSPSTGEVFTVDSSAYHTTGMQGQDPGYYRSIGTVGDVERLEPGYGTY
jgi:hypothetical protein